MARTKASVGAKVSSGKSSKARCCAAPPTTSSGSGTSDRAGRSTGGGNSVCPRETPDWQRPITNFFVNKQTPQEDAISDTPMAGSSKPRSKRIIHSDDDSSPEKPKNKVLDESLTLEPLTGEDSHKIEEYYPKNGEKGKGVGKKTKGKENNGKENIKLNGNELNGNKENEINGNKENAEGDNVKLTEKENVKLDGKENIELNGDRKRNGDEDISGNSVKRVKIS